METTRDFTINRRGLHFDLKTRRPVASKSDNTVYFSSSSEYQCYLSLDNIFSHRFNISTQPRYKNGVLDWRLDFKISGKTQADFMILAALARYCNNSNFSICSFLLIEYKGFADANFRRKLRLLADIDPLTYELLIVLSRKEDIYSFHLNGKKFSKPIYTPEKLGYIVESLI